MTTASPADDSSKLDAIIASYLEAIERGEFVDRELFLQQHPDFAEELRAFFVDFDRLQLTKMQPGRDPNVTFVPQHEPKPGSMIGDRYKLRENIGEGGMGSVWVAEQLQPVKRRVAIKLIKAGMDSKQVLARFEAERQALALMDHPNIAKVFDGGMTEHGRPYFVMEYVKGVPFTEYCDKARLSVKERLALFIPVCQAVQHAHHKGIVHRDLKPSNILICLYDGKPVPKVIDFGLAKAMHQQLTEQSIYTAHGVMVGTPLYMSPEQAEHNNLDVDTRTDVYSLGVILYELLTGSTPLEREQLRAAAYQEVLRLIKEVEPPRPSTRLSGSNSLPSIAAQRSIDPRHLQKSVAGDLDWIVMKSLEKERSRRYETANGLARDVERFLNDEAVEACPPSQLYRLRKYIHRNKRQVIAASIILSTMLIAITATTWGWKSSSDAAATVKKSLAEVTEERDAKQKALVAEAAQRDQAERQLCEGILRPIGHSYKPNSAELRAFIDWSALPDSHLRLKVLEVALHNPETALRVSRSSDGVMKACVGISPTRRAIALELLTRIQLDLAADPRIRVAAGCLALELGSTNTPALSETLTWLSNPIRKDKYTEPWPEFDGFTSLISSRAGQLSPEQVTNAGDALIGVLEKSNDCETLRTAGDCLVALSSRLSSEQITQAWTALINGPWRPQDWDFMQCKVGKHLAALAPTLTSDQVQHCGNVLLNVLENRTDKYSQHVAVSGLLALFPRLSAEQVARQFDFHIRVLETSTERATLESAEEALVELIPRLSSEQITRAWDTCIALRDKTTDEMIILTAWLGLYDLALTLRPEQTSLATDKFIAELQQSSSEDIRHGAVVILGELASKHTPDQVLLAFDATIDVLANTRDTSMLREAAQTLNTLAPKLNAEQLSRFANSLIAMLEDSAGSDRQRVAVQEMGSLAQNLDPEHVIRGWNALIRLLEMPDQRVADEQFYFKDVGASLEALVSKLSPEHLPRASQSLIGVFQKSTGKYALSAAARVLKSLAAKLSDDQITHGYEQLAVVLKTTTNTRKMNLALMGLAALAESLSPQQSTHAWDMLIGVLEKPEAETDEESVRDGLVVLVPKLPPEHVASAANAIIGILKQPANDGALTAASAVVVTLAPRLNQEQLTSSGILLVDVLKKNTGYARRVAMDSLVSLAPMLRPELRVQTAEAYLVCIRQLDYAHNFWRGNEKFLALVPYLDSRTQCQAGSEALTFLLSKLALSDGYFETMGTDLNPIRPVIMAIPDARLLATFLKHPVCIGEPREWMLQRFEELVFHNGERVFLPLPKPEPGPSERQGNSENPSRVVPANQPSENQDTEVVEGASDLGGLTSSRSPSSAPVRRFHTVHDAAAWIEHNWPDFDLDATMPVEWHKNP